MGIKKTETRGKAVCYSCGRRLTRKEINSFVKGYPFKICNVCAGEAK